MAAIDRARAYLAKLPPAIAGQRGHAATFAAACRLVEFGLLFGDALTLLLEWNQTHCKPVWTERELRHKLTDAFRVTIPKEQFTGCSGYPRRTPCRLKKPGVGTADAQTKRATADFSASFFDQSPVERQFSALASLRMVSFEVAEAFERRRLYRICWRVCPSG